MAEAETASATLSLNLEDRRITMQGVAPLDCEIDPARRRALMLGLDQIGETLQEPERISRFQHAYLADNPWLAESAT